MIKNHPKIKELKFTLNRIFTNPSAIIGFSLLLFFIVVAIFAPQLAPPNTKSHNPYIVPHEGFSATPKQPSAEHLMGTTSGQYDIFYGVVWGTRTAFKVGLFVVSIAALIGVMLGVIAGFYGGLVDEIIMRFVDIVFSVPLLVLAMAIVVAFERDIKYVIIALIMVEWRNYVRVMRASILTLRDQDFIHAAKVMGVSDIKIMLRHIIPNGIYPVMVIAFMDIGSLVITASFLSFLGLGAPTGYADWGSMVAQARNYIVGPTGEMFKYWHTIIFPGGCIILFVLAWNLIGDALRDAFDPKMRRQ
ncbi:MAG: ABC transporter permease [Desulfobacterales bacterium]|nr:ABC transporter permease [Desulfobacterales bacterium]